MELDLNQIRKEIDKIDSSLTELFEKRMHLVTKVALYKKENDLPIFHPTREKEVISKNVLKLKDKNMRDDLYLFFTQLMEISKNYQKKVLSGKVNIGYQGIDGSFSSVATEQLFEDEEVSIKTYKEFKNVFEALKNGEIDYGILPIENSSTGTITDNIDLMRENDAYILNETLVRAEQNIVGLKGASLDQIQRVFSHPQGFAQSMDFLEQYPDWELIPFHNTAISAKHVADMKNPHMAAIAGKRAANIYGLSVLAENINDNSKNYTRFIKVGRRLVVSPDADKITLTFSVRHTSGSLNSVIQTFSDNNINMLTLESRPVQNRPWEYYFFVDIEGNLKQSHIQKAINDMSKYTTYQKVLGCYKREVF